jgi:hypothetical protein
LSPASPPDAGSETIPFCVAILDVFLPFARAPFGAPSELNLIHQVR